MRGRMCTPNQSPSLSVEPACRSLVTVFAKGTMSGFTERLTGIFALESLGGCCHCGFGLVRSLVILLEAEEVFGTHTPVHTCPRANTHACQDPHTGCACTRAALRLT